MSLQHTAKVLASLSVLALFLSSFSVGAQTKTALFWQNATVYFMLTDRFNNADPSNDQAYNRTKETAKLRGFEGGDIKGITEKIEQGYFNRLGVDAIWMTPLIEQVHGYDDSDGLTYSYHGYWPKDWTAVDANFGDENDLKQMIASAHQQGIKVLLDVIINHTGPKTQADWAWPDSWIRTKPICQWHNYQENTQCALATSLTDIKTESEAEVELPPQLIKKWQTEGRLKQELAELDRFFERTKYPRAPKYYIVKWLTDWVRDYGVDGFRVDTAKHVEAEIWAVLKKESEFALKTWKQNNPQQVQDDLPFYMVGEVYHWGINGYGNTAKDGLSYDYGDKQVNFFEHGFDALINMGFVADAGKPIEQTFSSYSKALNNELSGKGVLSYIGSHDDQNSYDRERSQPFETAFKLMLAPGGVQIYYGDELARPMYAENAYGDANMRTPMNWQDIKTPQTQAILAHWQKLGKFRQHYDVVGSGTHKQLSQTPYIFKRELSGSPSILVAKDLPIGAKTISVYELYADGEQVFDHYSNTTLTVRNGSIKLNNEFTYALIGKAKVKM